MTWYKKQLKALMKDKDSKKAPEEATTKKKHAFDPTKIKGAKNSMNPVAQRNRNRPKTDLY